jgi:hypothetical protein
VTRRTVGLLAAAFATLAVLVLVVFPTRSYLGERHNLNSTAHQLQSLNAQNRQLSNRIGSLNTDSEIERLARKDYGLVKQGEEAYAILPGTLAANAPGNKANNAPPRNQPPAKPPPPPAAPANASRSHAAPTHQGLWERFLDQLAFWR